jgi:hypothetical protein
MHPNCQSLWICTCHDALKALPALHLRLQGDFILTRI